MVRAHPHLLNPRPASLLRLRPVSVVSVARELLEPEEEEDRLWQSRIKVINLNVNCTIINLLNSILWLSVTIFWNVQ